MPPRAQVLGIFPKKGPMSLHLRHMNNRLLLNSQHLKKEKDKIFTKVAHQIRNNQLQNVSNTRKQARKPLRFAWHEDILLDNHIVNYTVTYKIESSRHATHTR